MSIQIMIELYNNNIDNNNFHIEWAIRRRVRIKNTMWTLMRRSCNSFESPEPSGAQWSPVDAEWKFRRTKIIDRMGHVGTLVALVFSLKNLRSKKKVALQIILDYHFQNSCRHLQSLHACTADWHPGECSDDSIAREEVRSPENERLGFSFIFGFQICIVFFVQKLFCCKLSPCRFSWCDEFRCHPCPLHQPVAEHGFLSSACTARPWYVHK